MVNRCYLFNARYDFGRVDHLLFFICDIFTSLTVNLGTQNAFFFLNCNNFLRLNLKGQCHEKSFQTETVGV